MHFERVHITNADLKVGGLCFAFAGKIQNKKLMGQEQGEMQMLFARCHRQKAKWGGDSPP